MGGKTMERKYAALAENILSHIGGKDNIIHMTHCVTRLRLELKDDKKADLDALNAMNGIAGTFWRGGQLQIMIGSQVKEVFAELVSCAGVPGEEPGTRQKPGQPGEKEIHIAAPVSGRVIALSQIEDEAFASGVSRDPSIGWKNLCAGRWNDHHIFFDGTRDQPDGRSGTRDTDPCRCGHRSVKRNGIFPQKETG